MMMLFISAAGGCEWLSGNCESGDRLCLKLVQVRVSPHQIPTRTVGTAC